MTLGETSAKEHCCTSWYHLWIVFGWGHMCTNITRSPCRGQVFHTAHRVKWSGRELRAKCVGNSILLPFLLYTSHSVHPVLANNDQHVVTENKNALLSVQVQLPQRPNIASYKWYVQQRKNITVQYLHLASPFTTLVETQYTLHKTVIIIYHMCTHTHTLHLKHCHNVLIPNLTGKHNQIVIVLLCRRCMHKEKVKWSELGGYFIWVYTVCKTRPLIKVLSLLRRWTN